MSEGWAAFSAVVFNQTGVAPSVTSVFRGMRIRERGIDLSALKIGFVNLCWPFVAVEKNKVDLAPLQAAHDRSLVEANERIPVASKFRKLDLIIDLEGGVTSHAQLLSGFRTRHSNLAGFNSFDGRCRLSIKQ